MQFIKENHPHLIFLILGFLCVLALGMFFVVRTEKEHETVVEPHTVSSLVKPLEEIPLKDFDPTQQIGDISSVVGQGGRSSESVATMQSLYSPAEVIGLYEASLRREGWSVQIQREGTEKTVLIGSKNVSGVIISATSAGKSSEIQIITRNQ